MGEVTAFVHPMETNAFSGILPGLGGDDRDHPRRPISEVTAFGQRGLAEAAFAGVPLK